MYVVMNFNQIVRCNNCSITYKIDYLCCSNCVSACHTTHKVMPVRYNGVCICCQSNPKCRNNSWVDTEKKIYTVKPSAELMFDREGMFEINTRLSDKSGSSQSLFDINTRGKSKFMNSSGNDILFSRIIASGVGRDTFDNQKDIDLGCYGKCGVSKSYTDFEPPKEGKDDLLDEFYFSCGLLNTYYNILSNKKFALATFGVFLSLTSLYLGSTGRLEYDLKQLLQCDVSSKYNSIVKNNNDIMSYYGILGSTMLILNEKIPVKIPYYEKIQPITYLMLIKMNCLEPELRRVNKQIESHSKNTIVNFFSPGSVTLDTNGLLISYYYFYSALKTGFTMVKKEMFVESDLKTRTVDMMHLSNSYQYYSESSNNQLLEMEYMDPNFRFGLFLSKEKKFDELNIYIKNLRKIIIDYITMPKINQTSKFFINELYKKTNQLSLNTNETTNISPYSGTVVNKIINYISFKLDENGGKNENFIKTKTGINILVNHDFVYYVRHVPSNTMIIMGSYD